MQTVKYHHRDIDFMCILESGKDLVSAGELRAIFGCEVLTEFLSVLTVGFSIILYSGQLRKLG